MRPLLFVPTIVATSALLAACNSAAPLYASGPWWPGVARPYPAYAPIVSPKPFQLDVPPPVDVAPPAYGAPVRTVRTGVGIPPDPTPPDLGGPAVPPPGASLMPAPKAAPAPSRPASLPPAASSSAVRPSTRPSSYAGTWKAMDARGRSCRVQLSSVPALDLYRASSAGCTDGKLGTVNAWSLRDGGVVLFSHGTVIARLTGFEASLSGSLTSGGALKMTR